MNTEKIMKKIFEKEDISIEESEFLFRNILTGQLNEPEISNILLAMKLKGETPDEIAGLIKVLDEFKVKFPKVVNYCVDTCGTGGDNKSCFNISTATAIVVSAGGIPVAKHGNSAQSGLVGSADILKFLNIPVELPVIQGKKLLKDKKFVFLYAPKYHPSMKYVAQVRKRLRVRTIFNFVGPLVNPAEPEFQIIGVGEKEKLKTLIETSRILNRRNLVFYSSLDGYDEISSYAPTECYFVNDEVKRILINPEEFFSPFKMPVIKDRIEAIELFNRAISGEDDNLAKLLALNSSLVFYHVKGLNSIKEGYEYAYEIIKNKKAMEKLESLREE